MLNSATNRPMSNETVRCTKCPTCTRCTNSNVELLELLDMIGSSMDLFDDAQSAPENNLIDAIKENIVPVQQ